MDTSNLADLAVATSYRAISVYTKFLSANDSGATGAHQAGVLLSNNAMPMIFGEKPQEHIAKKEIKVLWQNDITTNSTFTWYTSKGEMRVTGLGRGFPYLNPDVTGALFVFCQMDKTEYEAFILNSEEEIDTYLNAFSLGPQDTGRILDPISESNSQNAEQNAIRLYVSGLGVSEGAAFPASVEISATARKIQNDVYNNVAQVTGNPDAKLVEYTRVEYAIFREIEAQAYGTLISVGFGSVEEFVELANTVLNRRKSRAGKSLEHHLSSIFRANQLPFEEQVVTEGNKKPDFVFPSGKAYHDLTYATDGLVVLAAKTTCKDRWRQILNEANRTKDGTHYLVTLQQGISPKQLDEMKAENVRLVVPKEYFSAYPKEYRKDIWSLKDFIGHTRQRLEDAHGFDMTWSVGA